LEPKIVIDVEFLLFKRYRHFIGTALSTFSFRIHEEREILGFQPKTTFNCFCGDSDKNCEQPTKWVVVYNWWSQTLVVPLLCLAVFIVLHVWCHQQRSWTVFTHCLCISVSLHLLKYMQTIVLIFC